MILIFLLRFYLAGRRVWIARHFQEHIQINCHLIASNLSFLREKEQGCRSVEQVILAMGHKVFLTMTFQSTLYMRSPGCCASNIHSIIRVVSEHLLIAKCCTCPGKTAVAVTYVGGPH
jgi:hypothetical protein